MTGPIVYVDTSKVWDGKLEELTRAMDDLIAFIELNEPDILAYNVYFKDDGSIMTVMHMHSSQETLEFHMKVAGPLFAKFTAFLEMQAIDVYGEISDDLVARLKTKAETLGSGVVRIHSLYGGLIRGQADGG
ncbi:MAG: hypothetical protein ACRDIU_08195 [Actinomycetota bacterium]